MLTSGEIFFTLAYTILCSVIILKVPYFKKFELSARVICGIFLFKVLAGGTYGLIHYYVYKGGDTFSYFHDGKIVFRSIDSDGWWMYLRLVFGFTKPEPAPDIIPFRDTMSYYTIMNSYFMVRFHALANLLTGCHYYANMVIYNFLTLVGLLYLFKFCYRFLPDKKNWVIAGIFVFPSVTFWSSGVHKDGLSLAAIGMILYFTSKLTTKQFQPNASSVAKAATGLIIGLWLLFVVRNYLLLLLFPCIIGFIWTLKFPKYAVMKYVSLFIIYYTVIFNLEWINPSWSLLREMSAQQQEFLQLAVGMTSRGLPPIENQFVQFVMLIPIALYHCMFLPLPWNISSLIQITSAIDNLIMLLLIVSLPFLRSRKINEKPFMIFCLLFAFSVFVFTGSIVPNIGALVRYKMPGVLFLMLGIFSLIETDKLKGLFNRFGLVLRI